MHRVVDMTTSALLAQVVPIISFKLRDLLGQKSEKTGEGFGKDLGLQ